jgi:hypothetical protein
MTMPMQWKNTFKDRALASLRLTLFVSCVAAAIAGVSLVRAYDRTEHVLGELGLGLLSELGSLKAGVEQVELNGERFTFGAAVSSSDPDTLISEFESECQKSSGTLEQDLAPLVAEARRRGAEIPDHNPARWTTMAQRTEDMEAAQAGCFVRGDDKSEGSLWKRIESFASTGKLGSLGGFRYVRADRAEDSDYTRVLAISSDAEFDIDRMIPDEGDARGSDPRVAPRPQRATRMFSAKVLSSGQGAYLYESEVSPEKLLAYYDGAVVAKGLERVSLSDGKGGEMPNARTYAAGDGAVVLSVAPGDDGKTLVTIVEFGQLPGEGK